MEKAYKRDDEPLLNFISLPLGKYFRYRFCLLPFKIAQIGIVFKLKP